MFLRNAWYVAGFSSELDTREMIALTILGEPVVIYRRQNGEVVALEDRCVHRQARLSLGRVEGDSVRCMYHGILFDHCGQVVEIPGQDTIPRRACIRAYPVFEISGWLWVWMGEPAKADAGLVPPVYGLHSPDWFLPEDQMDFSCNYQLMNNNLTDLGHLAWVHSQSFGADRSWATALPKVTMLDRGVRIDRWLPGIPPIPPLGRAADFARVDQWSRLDYFAPGIFHLHNMTFELGAMDRFGANAPPPDDPAILYETYSQQAVTPMTERTTRYFYSWGPSARTGTIEQSVIMRQVLAKAFQEDKDIITEQQRNMDLDPSRQPMLTVHDRGVVLFQRLMQKLMREEQGLEAIAPARGDEDLIAAD